MISNTSQRHDHIAAAVIAVLVGLAGVGAALNAAITATAHPVLVGLAAAVFASLVGIGWWLARRVRERREDAADTVAGAAWRAEHMPHLAAQTQQDQRTERAGAA